MSKEVLQWFHNDSMWNDSALSQNDFFSGCFRFCWGERRAIFCEHLDMSLFKQQYRPQKVKSNLMPSWMNEKAFNIKLVAKTRLNIFGTMIYIWWQFLQVFNFKDSMEYVTLLRPLTANQLNYLGKIGQSVVVHLEHFLQIFSAITVLIDEFIELIAVKLTFCSLGRFL